MTDHKQELTTTASQTQTMLSMLERMVKDPSVQIDRLERFIALQEQMLLKNAEQEYWADFAEMQNEMPSVGKDMGAGFQTRTGGQAQYQWASLDAINEVIKPLCKKYGFGISHRIQQGQGYVTVTGILSHRGGHKEQTQMTLPLDLTGSKNAVQSIGSTTSYGRRYVTAALLNISTSDDTDGHGLGAPVESNQGVGVSSSQGAKASRRQEAGAVYEQPAPAQQGAGLTAEQLAELRQALADAKMAEAFFCQSARIPNLESMAPARLAGALAFIRKGGR